MALFSTGFFTESNKWSRISLLDLVLTSFVLTKKKSNFQVPTWKPPVNEKGPYLKKTHLFGYLIRSLKLSKCLLKGTNLFSFKSQIGQILSQPVTKVCQYTHAQVYKHIYLCKCFTYIHKQIKHLHSRAGVGSHDLLSGCS